MILTRDFRQENPPHVNLSPQDCEPLVLAVAPGSGPIRTFEFQGVAEVGAARLHTRLSMHVFKVSAALRVLTTSCLDICRDSPQKMCRWPRGHCMQTSCCAHLTQLGTPHRCEPGRACWHEGCSAHRLTAQRTEPEMHCQELELSVSLNLTQFMSCTWPAADGDCRGAYQPGHTAGT